MLSAALLCLVVAVSDGDTLKLRCGEPGAYRRLTVRLHAVDAPELGQPFGRSAKRALADIAYRKTARLDCGQTDRYGRRVCDVWVAPASCAEARCPKTLDVGLAMLTVGMAWWSRAHASEQSQAARGRYSFAEREAKARRVGLWAERHPVPPWQWRPAHPYSR